MRSRISSVLLSRFLLDLRDVHTYPTRSAHTQTAMGSIKFSPRGDAFSSVGTPTSILNVVRDFEDPDDVVFAHSVDEDTEWTGSVELREVGGDRG